MSEQATVSTGADRRTIGAILRSHGYVTDAQLEDAAGVQARTGKPLGQVLVEAGTITRLELASALAEQWSDSSEWMHTQDSGGYSASGSESSNGIGLTAPRYAPDNGALASRLSAVEAALQDVLRSEPSSGPLEHAIADLARRLTTWEPVLAEVERQSSAIDAEALETQLGELAETIEAAVRRADASAETLADFGTRLDELQLAIRQARDDAGTASASAAAELARLAEAVESVRVDTAAGGPAVTPDEIGEIRARLVQLADRPTGSPELQARLDDIASRLDEVASRPVHDRELGERVERLSQLVAVLAQDSRLDALQSEVAHLASRPAESPELAERLDDLSRRVDALIADAGARVDGDVSDELRAALEELATRPPVDAALAARVEELAQRLAEMPTHSAEHDDSQVAELTRGMEMLAGRLSEVERNSDLRALTQTVDELASRPVVEAGLGDRVWRLAERIDELADALAATSPDGEIRELRSTVEALASRPAGDPDRLDWVGSRIEDVTGRIDALSRSLDAATAAPAPAVTPEQLAGIEARLDDLTRQLAELPTESSAPLDAAALSSEIESRLTARLDERLAARPDDSSPATESLAADLARNAELWYAGRAALEARLEGLEARIAARPASTSAAADGAKLVPHVFEQEVERVLMAVERLGLHLSEHDRALAELMSRRGSSKVEELAARVDELETYGVAAGAVVSGTGADGAPAPVSLADTRDLRGELRSLTRQVTDLEDSSKADREKFLTQLERMASSIDWRIRRIESGESAA
jgi:tetrahydromethanopterin S-methyltransferase subunit G/chaperonin cofactor prefoldin